MVDRMDDLPARLAAKLHDVEEQMRASAPLVVAYSGGVDSSCLLAIGHRLLGGDCLGVIADSPSLPRRALAAALEQAAAMGAHVEVLKTEEFDDPRYAANPPDRCYFCKAELFHRLDALARQRGFKTVTYGENADDPPTTRPGSRAAEEFQVLSPLRSADVGKSEVRELAAFMGLESADRPAAPCLSSRIAHGIPVSRTAIEIIERAESVLHRRGFRIFRVRLVGTSPLAAVVQVAPAELGRLDGCRDLILDEVCRAGFEVVTIDPDGYRGAGLR